MRGDPETQIKKRDSAALYDSLDAIFLSPAKGFDELATTYDQRMADNPLLAVESVALFEALPSVTGKHVTDIGCGTGRHTLALANMGAETVTGIDISSEMLLVAKRKARRTDLLPGSLIWRQGDLLERLPMEDGSTDMVVCALTLSFLSQIQGAFQEIERILAPGGTLLISDYHPHSLFQARAESTTKDGNKSKAPFLRFTAADGNDCRIAQYPYRLSDLLQAAQSVHFTLDHLSEPFADRQIMNAHTALRNQTGIPLTFVARFQKVS